MEIRVQLQPKQRELYEKMETTPVLFYGGAKGGGKSRGMRDVFLLRRFKYPKTNAGIFRQTYPELEANHIRPLFQNYPGLRQYYNDSKKLLSLPNGSTIEFCYAANEKDLSNYQGREFDDLGIEEAGQWHEAHFRTLHGSNRSSKPGVKPRCLLTGNPGGLGHGWLKRLFVERRFNSNERPEDYAFIQAKVYDNQALMANDPDYVHRLQANPNEALRRAYLDGDWDIFAGQFFTELSREKHLIKPFEIPKHWLRFGAYDYGFNHPGVFGWFACDEDGNVYLYREWAKAKHRVDMQAAAFLAYPDTLKLEYIVAGHDCWKDTGVTKTGAPPTIAEEFLTHGINLQRANIGRIQGASQVRNYLAWQGTTSNRPRFFIFDTCPIAYDCLTRMQHDPDRLEDVLKVDAVEGDPLTGDDPYDMVRMGLMSRPPISERLEKYPKPGTPEWVQREAEEMERIALERITPNPNGFPDDPWAKDSQEFGGEWRP